MNDKEQIDDNFESKDFSVDRSKSIEEQRKQVLDYAKKMTYLPKYDYERLPSRLENDEVLCETLLNDGYMPFSYLSFSLRSNKDFILKCFLENDNLKLINTAEHIHASLWNDKEFVKSMMTKNVNALEYAFPYIQKDREVLTHGLKINPVALLEALNNNEMFWNLDFLKEAFTYTPSHLYMLIRGDLELNKSFLLTIDKEDDDFYLDALKKLDEEAKNHANFSELPSYLLSIIKFTVDHVSLNSLNDLREKNSFDSEALEKNLKKVIVEAISKKTLLNLDKDGDRQKLKQKQRKTM